MSGKDLATETAEKHKQADGAIETRIEPFPNKSRGLNKRTLVKDVLINLVM
jgi:hypothetical protein